MMSEVNTRIEQFRKMAEDDPGNELGHFSLGRAYLEAGMDDPAIASLGRALQINPNLSRAYQLMASALMNKGQRDAAVERLTRGVEVAAARGDVLPGNEMARMLQDMGVPVPKTDAAQADQPVGEGQVRCVRCGNVGPKLAKPPFRNPQGQMIFDRICQPCWREWIGMGTKVINELRLPLNDPQAQKVYDQHMLEFLNLK